MSKMNISRQIENLSSYKNYSKQQILQEIYDHTINQKKQEGILSTIQLKQILHVLNRDDILVIDEIDYWKKAINNKEPKEAIIFHHNKNTSIGHWVCAYTIVFKSKIGLGNARQREENFGERSMFV